jgi:hypothetical protein
MDQAIYQTSPNSTVFPFFQCLEKASNFGSGDEAVRQDLEGQVADFNVSEWWQNKMTSPTEIAEANVKSGMKQKTATLYNPYEGQFCQFCARQLSESVEDFLQRLPPQTTPVSEHIPWIFIANPYRKAPKAEEVKQGDINGEAPSDEDSDWAQFVVRAGKLLKELTVIMNDIKKKKAGQAKASITKAYHAQRDLIVNKVLDTAVELHCTSGKVSSAPSHLA